jgi:hypothetical protein
MLIAREASGLSCPTTAVAKSAGLGEDRTILEGVVDYLTDPFEKLIGGSDWRDVRYLDASDLTVLPLDQLDPATRARLEATAAAGRAREAAAKNRSALIKALIATGLLVGGVVLVMHLVGRK